MQLPILYKRASNGKISTWQIEVENNLYRTVSGYTDGLKITSEWTECFGKNIGKSNETTDSEQAMLEATSKHQHKLDLGFWEDINKVDIAKFFKPMLAKEFEDYYNKILYPWIENPKLDGMRGLTDFSGMFSRNGNEVISAPHVNDSLISFFEKYPNIILDGELYADRSLTNFNQLISMLRKTVHMSAIDLAMSKKYVKLHIFDVASHSGTLDERYDYLYSIQSELPDTCMIIDRKYVNNPEEVLERLEYYESQGYEGIMLKNPKALYQNKRSKDLLKLKTFITDEFEIAEIEEGKGKLSGRIGHAWVKLPNGKTCKASVNGDHDYLQKLWEEQKLIGKMATVKYQSYTPDGKLLFPKILEIRDYE